eukprot:g48241.t1
MTGDFNQANLKQMMPKYHQHISCPTRGVNILDYCYTTTKDVYRSIPHPHFRKSNHSTVFLLPAYKEKVKLENPSRKEVQCWPKAAEDWRRVCFDSVDWNVFKCSVENLEEYASTVTDFISKCTEICVPKKSICVFPNRKPWLNQEIHSLPKTRRAAFKSGEPDRYRKSRYDLRKAIREAKRQYETKLEVQTYQMDCCCLWQGLNGITGYKMKQCNVADKDTSLPDTFNAFYARFEQNTTDVATPALTAPNTPVPAVTASEVTSDFLRVKPKKVMGPDGVPGQALRSWADQLAEVFTNIFNLSLLQAEVPTYFEKTTIIPIPKKRHT